MNLPTRNFVLKIVFLLILSFAEVAKGTSSSIFLILKKHILQYFTLLHLSVSTRGVIGQFCGPYFTVRPTKFESFLSRTPD